MTEKALLRTVPNGRALHSSSKSDWMPTLHQIVIGKDILELLSTSMYVDPMTIYREYTQNAADAIDEAYEQGLLAPSRRGQLEVAIDPASRSIRIRDNGAGVPWRHFAERLSNLGASTKRGTSARGFRGVGRLAGLGYCQELTFRSRTDDDQLVSELRWDCRELKSVLRSAKQGQHLVALVQDVISLRRTQANGFPLRFFEVELKGVIRHRNDRLLNPVAVGDYLAQVAPVPFSPDFTLGADISAALRPHVRLGELEIRINGATQPVYRPHHDAIEIGDRQFDKVTDLELHELAGVDGGLAAVAWILHHGYAGAIPSKALIKGIRLRTGNMQVGDHALLEELFPEPRFNGWAVGEVHIIDTKVIPNGRRDNFEQSVHFDNLLNQLTPTAREIARRCRQSSIARKWLREFALHKSAAIDTAKAVARGGLSRAARRAQTDSVAKSLKAMRKVVNTRHLGDDTRAALVSEAETVEGRVIKLLGGVAREQDPLAHFKPQTRTAYQHIISLIYDCTRNRVAASALVDKILGRLEAERNSSPSQGQRRSRRSTRQKKATRRT